MYQHCYFRIEANYTSLNKERVNYLFDEIVELFNQKGWKTLHDYGDGRCPEIQKGKSVLYVHPQALSGDVDVDLIDEIEETLNGGIRFEFYKTDKYQEVFDWTDEQYTDYLNKNKDKIIEDLLQGFKTKRSNQVIIPDFSCGPIRMVCDRYEVRRIGTGGIKTSSNLDWNYVFDRFTQLVSSGKILVGSTNKGWGFRTATPKETGIVQKYLEWCCNNEKIISSQSTQEYIQEKLDEEGMLHDKEITPIFNYSEWTENSRSKEIRRLGINAVYDENEGEYRSENDDEIMNREQNEGMQML